jgi:adenine deaminase
MKEIKGKIIDIVNRKTFNGIVQIKDGKIFNIKESSEIFTNFILPGFVDSHVHIESSMLNPTEFSRLAVAQGTVGTVSDPHEIANVCGVAGIQYMIDDSKNTPVKIYFNAPSCVPATGFETSGANLDSNDIGKILEKDEIVALGEMMNYPGVIFDDEEVHKKIKASLDLNKPVDGHSPELSGKDLKKYINSGISTDHECASLDEAIEKIEKGMIIQIREGSAAKNFDQLHSLLSSHPDKCMLCTDDSHPDDLSKGHINAIAAKAIKQGHNIYNVLRAASLNAIKHYNLNIGLLQIGDPADFVICSDITTFNVISTYIDGEPIYDNNRVLFQNSEIKPINNFKLNKTFIPTDFEIKSVNRLFKIIKAFDGSLLTDMFEFQLPIRNGVVYTDPLMGINKITVINRYSESSKPVIGFIQGFNFSKGAIASTVAHDSHNIIAIGADDESISKAVNRLIKSKGGLALYDGNETLHLPLPIAGLMSNENAQLIANAYEIINNKTHNLGCSLNSPFMTMAFMALLVIPKLKIGDKGLFDVENFKLTNLES